MVELRSHRLSPPSHTILHFLTPTPTLFFRRPPFLSVGELAWLGRVLHSVERAPPSQQIWRSVSARKDEQWVLAQILVSRRFSARDGCWIRITMVAKWWCAHGFVSARVVAESYRICTKERVEREEAQEERVRRACAVNWSMLRCHQDGLGVRNSCQLGCPRFAVRVWLSSLELCKRAAAVRRRVAQVFDPTRECSTAGTLLTFSLAIVCFSSHPLLLASWSLKCVPTPELDFLSPLLLPVELHLRMLNVKT